MAKKAIDSHCTRHFSRYRYPDTSASEIVRIRPPQPVQQGCADQMEAGVTAD